jgi:GcrA cell cycle regulator
MTNGWTDERVTLLKKLWTDGLSASQIAKQLGGVTRNAVIGKVHRLGLAGRAAPSRPIKRLVTPAPRPRTTAAIPVAEVPANGISDVRAGTIGTVSPRSPAGSGNVPLNGQSADSEPASISVSPATARSAKPANGAAPASGAQAASPAAQIAVPRSSVAPAKPARPVPAARVNGEIIGVLDLGTNMCKWPIGDPGDADFGFCGASCASGSVYCEEHAAIAFQPHVSRRPGDRSKDDRAAAEVKRLARLANF